jgi:hypothetical protein
MVAAIYDGSSSQALKDCAVAYLCDQILQGSFSHTGILARLSSEFPTAMVWYGAFSASGRKISKSKVKAILDKLHRDVVEPFSFESRPRSDISIEELRVVSRAGIPQEVLRPSHPRTLLVSLIPGVDIYARQPGGGVTQDTGSQDLRQPEASGQAIKLIEQALKILSGERNKSSTSDSRYKHRKGNR